MEKNFFDRLSDSYEERHFKDSEIHIKNNTLYISPKLKLILGWSLFILCSLIAYLLLGNPFTEKKNKGITPEAKQAVLEKEVDVEEEHETIIPIEKDDNEELNEFIEEYFNAITTCNNQRLQDMVTDPNEFTTADGLKKRAEFITGYSNLTVYTKEGLDDGSYIAFVVANLEITGVNSSPYDIVMLYIVTGAQGFRIMNGTLPEETQNYIDKVKGDKDIQKIFQSVSKENDKLVKNDKSLQDFYDIISRRNVETTSGADQIENNDAGQTNNNDAGQTENSNGDQTENNDAGQTENSDGDQTENNDAGQTENNDAGQTENSDAGQTENNDAE